jgi:hypothetical protein|tara:strand:+ start:6823 stop:6939 length:117 start_codon:yes stop_codon:yes gene_type:complete
MGEVFELIGPTRALDLPKLGCVLQKTDEMPWQDCGVPG